MKVVKNQLKAYHRGQGMKGKRLKRAVWADLGRAVANADLPKERFSCYTIASLFHWGGAPEGHFYWSARQGRSI